MAGSCELRNLHTDANLGYPHRHADQSATQTGQSYRYRGARYLLEDTPESRAWAAEGDHVYQCEAEFIEAIIGGKLVDGQRMYLVRWARSTDLTWEPEGYVSEEDIAAWEAADADLEELAGQADSEQRRDSDPGTANDPASRDMHREQNSSAVAPDPVGEDSQ